MVWIIIIIAVVAVYFGISYIGLIREDAKELRDTNVAVKFRNLAQLLNDAAFEGRGTIVPLNDREFNIHQHGSNKLLQFHYKMGILTITWKYKFFQKEVVLQKSIQDARNLSMWDEAQYAMSIIKEAESKFSKHQLDVLGAG